jgi:hydroxylysine kinase
VTSLVSRRDVEADPLLTSLFAAPTEPVTCEEACDIVRQHYALDVEAKRLSSERDEIFHLRDPGGVELLLKITNPAEPEIATDLQTSALQWIARIDPSLPVQRILPAQNGRLALRLLVGGERRTVRLLSYLRGQPLHESPSSARQRHNLGSVLARLDHALAGFDHPAARHPLAWDLAHAERLRPLLAHIGDPRRLALASAALDRFATAVKPRLAPLRCQVIHNDLNLHNVLVDATDPDRVTGIIDFGDMVRTHLVNDAAIAAAYHLSSGPDPLGSARDILAGYGEAVPLLAEEIALVPDLMATRLLVTVLITGWRAQLQPSNSAYILKNNGRAWDGLELLASLPPEATQHAMLSVCTNR